MAVLNIIASDKSETVKTLQPLLLNAPKPEDAQVDIKKQEEFETFLLWFSMPSFFRKPPRDRKTGFQPQPREFCESLGVEDEKLLELCEIPTQSAFAEKYGVSIDTLTDWKKKIRERDLLGDLRMWAEPMMKNVMMAHYNQCIRGGLPEHFKLFYQVIGQWNEKVNIDIRKRTIKTVEVNVIHSNKA